MEGPAQSRYATAGALSVTLVAWLAIAQYVGETNMYFAITDTAVPTLLLGLTVPLMIASAGLWLSRTIASLVSAIPLRWLVAAQVYRIGGGIFLVLWAEGRLPWQFALPAGIGDVMTGLLAIVVAAQLSKNTASARSAVYAWCLFGIAESVSGDYHWSIDLSRAAAPLGLRGAQPPHNVLSASDGANLRRPASSNSAWRRTVAPATKGCFE
jgi:hypothetical protein